MASLALRSGVKVSEVIDQLKGISCPACTTVRAKGGKIDGISCPDIIAKTIAEFIANKPSEPLKSEESTNVPVEYEECPECHEKTLIREAGCKQCTSCGYSKCE
jgi:ribonucleoside-diphosphate reductase alpha chain